MTELSVNLNKIALLRNQRDVGFPDVNKFANIAIDAGAYGITVHPRPDERHIQYNDVFDLRALARSRGVEFNIEGNPFTGRYIEVVNEVCPHQATLVPDDPNAVTSDHGWDLKKDGQRLRPIISELKSNGIRVSLFMDADAENIKLAKDVGADRIELYTEPYAAAYAKNKGIEESVGKFADAADAANKAGLGINAGHDLNLDNLGHFCSKVDNIIEVSIGHALVSDALEMGFANAVSEYKKILESVK